MNSEIERDSLLASLPFDCLKIDRSFISRLGQDSKSDRIVDSIVGLGKSLDLEVVGEGVETPSQLDFLVKAGCDYAQGYLFGRPMTPELVVDLLAGDSPWTTEGILS